ncbi:FBD-associated F-box protein [Melia azedarach]|uniref:FBD-associated F-box protein n=1 Tax=Melia azedarach TaxID=155640 RepID=A0ACC1X6E1_MELAZ|nr:FBD-associated F-box protein [Melia azedarach]
MDRKSDCSNQEKEDRFSGLPDPILRHILSFLPTKDAVATSILSSRWKLVWTSLTNLCFDDRLCLEDEEDTDVLTNDASTMFENFVNRVLVLSYPVDINKFSLHCCQLRYLACLQSWVSTAIMRNVREIELGIKMDSFIPIELPESIYTSRTLEVLKLNSDFAIRLPPSGLCFPSLKILHVEIDDGGDNLTETLLSNCPVLEDMSIMVHLYGHFATFNISSCILKRLTLRFLHEGELYLTEHHVVITAPNLDYLSILDWPPVSYMLYELHSLTKVVVDFSRLDAINPYNELMVCSYQAAPCVVQLLKFITKTKFLSLTIGTIHVLDCVADFFPRFPNLTCLEVEVLGRWELLFVLLSRAPNLESLIADIGFDCNWTKPHFVPDCLLSHLKTIKIRGIKGEKNQLKLIKYLLKNGEVLDTLIICLQRAFPQKMGLKDKLYQELLIFERGSKTCKVKVL